MADKSLNAQYDILSKQQGFSEMQSKLDRDQQVKLMDLQNTMNKSNVSDSFAATTSQNLMNAINAIQMDPNLTPEAKKSAMDNVIGNANSTLQWGSTFYNTPLPSIAGPGATPGTINPYVPGSTQAAPATPEVATPAAPTPAVQAPDAGLIYDPNYQIVT
jgi:hypothetical protein